MADLLLKPAGLIAVGHALYSRELDLLGADKHTNDFMVSQMAMCDFGFGLPILSV